jgi:hypothetical protein
MVIENKNKTIRITQLRYIAVIVFLPLIVLLVASEIVKTSFMGLNRFHWAIVLALVYLGINIYEHIRNFNYIFIDDSDSKIIFRYISLKPFHNKKYSIEIEKEKFHSYKIDRSLLNLKKEIVLYVDTPQGIAKYPPISITALDGDNINKLKHMLNQYALKS